MRLPCLGLLVGLCALAGPASASDVVSPAALDEQTYDMAGEGVIQLLCESQDGRLFLSRAIVLDTPAEAGREILITARHAVYDEAGRRSCSVRGAEPEVADIAEILSSSPEANERGDFNHDWAVLRTTGRLENLQQRVRPALLDGQGGGGEVTLLVRALTYEPCEIIAAPPELEDPTLIFHTCPSRPGLSGSPMLVQINDQPYVIGVHLGQFVMLDETGLQYSVARRLSDDFLAALLTALAEDDGG